MLSSLAVETQGCQTRKVARSSWRELPQPHKEPATIGANMTLAQWLVTSDVLTRRSLNTTMHEQIVVAIEWVRRHARGVGSPSLAVKPPRGASSPIWPNNPEG